MTLMVTAAVGCGGGSNAGDTRAELRRWRSAVDEVCRTTHQRIVARGGAHDASDVKSVATRAGKDVRGAAQRIRGLAISRKARAEVRPFLAEVARIDARLENMASALADGSLGEIGKLGLRLADATKRLQDGAEASGLRQCADARQFNAVLDAFTAPVYATQIARLDRWLDRRLIPMLSEEPPTPAAFVRQLRGVSRAFDGADDRLFDLYVYRPNRAVDAEKELKFALSDYETFLTQTADLLRGGRRVLTPVGARQFRRDDAKHGRQLRLAFARLRRAIGAEPLPGPGVRPPADPADAEPA